MTGDGKKAQRDGRDRRESSGGGRGRPEGRGKRKTSSTDGTQGGRDARGARKPGPTGGARRPGDRGRRFRGPRMEIMGNALHVFVSMPDRFYDDAIRGDYVLPIVDAFNVERIESVVYKAKGQAINVAVRAALLLEEIMGVMKKKVEISSSLGKPRANPSDATREQSSRSKRSNRLVSSIDITMTRF